MIKKKINRAIASALAACLLFALVGCAPEKEKELWDFSATVVEVYENEIIVRPDDGSDELRSADRISVSIKSVKDGETEFSAGDHVGISYNGDIMETYPAMLGEVTEVAHID